MSSANRFKGPANENSTKPWRSTRTLAVLSLPAPASPERTMIMSPSYTFTRCWSLVVVFGTQRRVRSDARDLERTERRRRPLQQVIARPSEVLCRSVSHRRMGRGRNGRLEPVRLRCSAFGCCSDPLPTLFSICLLHRVCHVVPGLGQALFGRRDGHRLLAGMPGSSERFDEIISETNRFV